MRDFKGMKRQRGRNRKPGGGSGGGGGGGGGGGHNPNRAFESNGPENVKIRGAAQHVYERYQQLARDSFASGDRVLAENYLQHAEHYFRVLRTLQPQRPVSEIAARDAFASGFDIDFEDENGDEIDTTSTDPQDDAPSNEQPQADYRGDRNGNGGGNDRNEFRRDREFRGDRNGGEPRQDNRPPRNDARPEFRNEPRNEPRTELRSEARPDAAAEARAEGERRESRRERFERRREERARNPEGQDAAAAPVAHDPLAVVEPKAAPLVTPAAEEGSPMLRAQDGAESQMPAFLRQPVASAAPAAEVAEKPRRTRRRRPESFEAATEGEAPAEEQA